MTVTVEQTPATGTVQRGRLTMTGNFLVVADYEEAYVEEVGVDYYTRATGLVSMIEDVLNDETIVCRSGAMAFGRTDDTSAEARKQAEDYVHDLQARLEKSGYERNDAWVADEIDRWFNYNAHNQEDWREETGKNSPPLVRLKVTVDVERLSETESLALWAKQREYDKLVIASRSE